MVLKAHQVLKAYQVVQVSAGDRVLEVQLVPKAIAPIAQMVFQDHVVQKASLAALDVQVRTVPTVLLVPRVFQASKVPTVLWVPQAGR